jgi:hypothetical protein
MRSVKPYLSQETFKTSIFPIFIPLWTTDYYSGGTLHIAQKFAGYKRIYLELLQATEVETHAQIFLS